MRDATDPPHRNREDGHVGAPDDPQLRTPGARPVWDLYPKPTFDRPNHNDLTRLLHPMEDMPREFTSGGHDLAAIRAQGQEFWADLQRQVKRANPTWSSCPVSTSTGWTHRRLEVLRGMLHELTTDIEVVCYVREPASYYVSFTQQVVKASYRILAPVSSRPPP